MQWIMAGVSECFGRIIANFISLMMLTKMGIVAANRAEEKSIQWHLLLVEPPRFIPFKIDDFKNFTVLQLYEIIVCVSMPGKVAG